MSFDVYMRTPSCEHCGSTGSEVFDGNITHNVNGIVEACLAAAGGPVATSGTSGCREYSWGRLEGYTGEEAAPFVERALAEANSPNRRAEFEGMEPGNGWGSLYGVQEFFANLLSACRKHPKAIIHTSG